MSRLDNIMNNLNSPNVINEVILVGVAPERVYSVLHEEKTAVVTKADKLKKYKTIVLISASNIVAIGKITSVIEYNEEEHKNMWGTGNAWRSTIKFNDVIPLLDNVYNVFGKNNGIKNTETVAYFHNLSDIEKLKELVKQSYVLTIRNHLERLKLLE